MTHASLASAIRAYLDERAWEVRLHVASQALSLLLLRRSDSQTQWLELRGKACEGEQAQASLKALGLRVRRHHGGGRALGMDVGYRHSATDLISLVDGVLAAVMVEVERDLRVDVSCQRDEPPENPRLLEAIRAASTTQDTSTRQRLYAALVNAMLLVPQDPKGVGKPEHMQEPFVLDGPTWIAFSDWDALRMWSPQGHPFGLVHGVDFFEHIYENGLGNVRVNPDGVVGGELYAGEVTMMVEAVRGYLRSQRHK